MEYVLDMQGFKQSGNDYILKELAIVSLNGEKNTEPVEFLFKAPFPWNRLTDKYKKQNTWLAHYYHGISWDAGDREYNTIGGILREQLHDASQIFVIGSIQKSWLERFKFKVEDIGELGYPPLHRTKLATVCPHHNGAYKASCALHNVRLMKQYLIECLKPLGSEPMDCI